MQDEFARLLRFARKEAGLTQREFAEILGVATGTVQQWELGVRFPRLEMLRKIEDTLKIALVPCDMEKKEIHFNSTPDPEWTDLYQKLEAGSITDEERKRFVKMIDDGIKNERKAFSEKEEKLLRSFKKLNEEGKDVAIERVDELTQIKKYYYYYFPDADDGDAAAPETGKK